MLSEMPSGHKLCVGSYHGPYSKPLAAACHHCNTKCDLSRRVTPNTSPKFELGKDVGKRVRRKGKQTVAAFLRGLAVGDPAFCAQVDVSTSFDHPRFNSLINPFQGGRISQSASPSSARRKEIARKACSTRSRDTWNRH